MGFMWTFNTGCKKWKTIFEEKVPIFEDTASVIVQNHYQNVWGLSTSWRCTFRNSSMKLRLGELQGKKGLQIPGRCRLHKQLGFHHNCGVQGLDLGDAPYFHILLFHRQKQVHIEYKFVAHPSTINRYFCIVELYLCLQFLT